MAAKRHYVNNRDFYEAIVAYREKLKEDPDARIPEYLGVCIFKICERLSTRPNFAGYSYRDEMVSDGIENCVKAVRLFDPARTNNPFAYFTQIAWNAFIRRISSEKREQYIKHKNIQHTYLSGEMDDMQHGDTGASFQMKNNDLSNEIIHSFESKLTKNKKQDKVSGVEKFLE
jgi:DNA-directed RNA polymerase specialized sigma24 family protein